MKVRRFWLSLSLLSALSALPRPAHADATLWQRAREPELARSEALADKLERLLTMGDASRSPGVARDFALAAVAAADLAGASRLPGARLKCLLGEVLVRADFPRRARDLLADVVDELPPGPLAATCYYSYGLALAYLGDAKGEIVAFTRALAFTEGRGPRANLLYNRADARVAEGELAAAIDDYRRAIALANHPEITALAYYGLAVALDRYGDLPAAWVALESAHRVAPPFGGLPGSDLLDAPSVFFVPAYEKEYYRALSRMAAARSADNAGERREHTRRALEHWEAFIVAAEPANDRYLENARLHALACRRELEKAR
jgi:tetratricopeptide (TPR) repeat protein